MSGWRAASAGLLALATALPAAADAPLWELGAGAGALRLPNYRGSSESRAWVLPVPYFVYRGEILRADRQGTRAVLLDADRFDFDVSVAASAPSSSEGDPAREGMPDLKPSFEIGPQLNVKLAQGAGWKVDLRAPVRAVVLVQRSLRSIGWSASPVVNLDVALDGGNFGLQLGGLWGTRRLHEYYYSVDPAFATATRPAYAAGSGYAGWQATVAYSRRIGPWWVGTFARRDSLAGAVFASSPLVRDRAPWTAGFAFSYVFAQSDERVPERR